MLSRSPTFNLDNLSTKSSTNSLAFKSFWLSPKNAQLTPLYFLQNPHRAINITTPRHKSSKRLSQKDSDLLLKEPSEPEEKTKPPSITVKHAISNPPQTMSPEKEKVKEKDKKKARASLMVSSNGNASYRPRFSGRKEGQNSSESPISVQESVGKNRYGESALVKKKSKVNGGKEMSALAQKSGKGLSPGRSFENSPLFSGNRKFDADYLLGIFGRGNGNNNEKGILNINIIKTNNSVVLGNKIRRKSCYCSDCGGMSSLEKQHLNIAIPPKRALRAKEPVSTSRRMSRLTKSPSLMENSPTAKEFKLLSSMSQGYKGGVGAFSTVITQNPSPQRGSFNRGLMRRDSLRLLDPVRRSFNTSENKDILESNENKESDEVITSEQLSPRIRGLVNKDSSGQNTSTFTSRASSQDMLTPMSTRAADQRDEIKTLPYIKMNFPNSNTNAGSNIQLSSFSAAVTSRQQQQQQSKGDLTTGRESSSKVSEKNDRKAEENKYYKSLIPQKMMLLNSRKPEEDNKLKSPLRLEEKKIRNVYHLPQPISQAVRKMRNTVTDSKERGKFNKTTITMSTKSFRRDEGPPRKRKERVEDNSKVKTMNDPYNMGKMSTRSYVIRSSNNINISVEKSKFVGSSRDGSEEKSGSSDSLVPIQVKLGKIVTVPLLSDRSYKRVEYGIGMGKSSTSIERLPNAAVERLEKIEKLTKKVHKKVKKRNFEALGLDKILKAYEL